MRSPIADRGGGGEGDQACRSTCPRTSRSSFPFSSPPNRSSGPHNPVSRLLRQPHLNTPSLTLLLPLSPQIRKQAELREIRKASGRGSKPPDHGGRAPKPLEAKWKLFVGRSPLCEGCGGNTAGRDGGGGSKVWKCGPCVRAVEDSYIRAMERQEVMYPP